ncbi:MAG: DNA-3-methyladenine glycosylase 2 family protein [Sandaracinaceae bacterium]|nr:DNA-3-methyladenine glycosylase 2 family protein [Sandaracinaceae bacterium]
MRRRVELPGPVDVIRTIRRHKIHGQDPTTRTHDGAAWTAFRTEDGPATVSYRQASETSVDVEAWGPGAERALDAAPALLGADDRPESFTTDDPRVAPLLRRFGALRFGKTGRVIERVVPTIIGQKVTGKGAAMSWRDLVFRYGERAPEPAPNLWLMPEPARFRELGYYDFHPLGIERKRAQIILDVTRRARKLEALVAEGPDALEARLLAFRGIGPWTASIVRGSVFGDPDAVVVGDYNLPNMVAFALAGESRGDDARMLELLEPFRPHRARVVAMLAMSGKSPPRFGPRLPVRDIRDQ